jgi:hypothetical protein
MDQQSRTIAGSVPGIVRNNGIERRFASLQGVYAQSAPDGRTGGFYKLYFRFAQQTLEVSEDDEFFTFDRLHLVEHPAFDPERTDRCTDLSRTPGFAPLIGLDLSALRWELLAGDIDQYMVLEFMAHRKHLGPADAALTICSADFDLRVYSGAPVMPVTEILSG